jgi:hypothetical protein
LTKVQVRYGLKGALDDAMLENIRTAQAIYGVERVQVLPSLTELMVEYDASRLRPLEIDAALRCRGIDVNRL